MRPAPLSTPEQQQQHSVLLHQLYNTPALTINEVGLRTPVLTAAGLAALGLLLTSSVFIMYAWQGDEGPQAESCSADCFSEAQSAVVLG